MTCNLVFVLVALRAKCTLPTVLLVLSMKLVHFIQDIIYFIQYLIYFIQYLLFYFTISTRAKYQRCHRMVKESTTSEASGNKNPSDTSNDSIAAAINKLTQDLDTLQAGNTSTGATHNNAPVLDPFSSDLTFDIYYRYRSTAF